MGFNKIVQSGNLLEIYQYEKSLQINKPRKKPNDLIKRVVKVGKRRADNARRLRKSFTRLIRSNLIGSELPVLATFTTFEVLRIDLAFRAFTSFMARCRRCFGREFRYITVPEFQKRGAPHFHTLIWGFPEEVIKNETVNRRIQNLWARGFVDLRPTDGSPKLAGYLSKYMSKALHDSRLLSQKAYATSRNIMRPLSFTNSKAFELRDMIWGVDKLLAFEVEFDTMYLGRCVYKSYKLE